MFLDGTSTRLHQPNPAVQPRQTWADRLQGTCRLRRRELGGYFTAHGQAQLATAGKGSIPPVVELTSEQATSTWGIQEALLEVTTQAICLAAEQLAQAVGELWCSAAAWRLFRAASLIRDRSTRLCQSSAATCQLQITRLVACRPTWQSISVPSPESLL
jgi:hypothetical protein